jgi:hypothetical protein
MIVVGSEGGVAFRAFPLPGFVARAQTVPAEHMEAFGEDGVFAFDLARRAGEGFLVLSNLLEHHLGK